MARAAHRIVDPVLTSPDVIVEEVLSCRISAMISKSSSVSISRPAVCIRASSLGFVVSIARRNTEAKSHPTVKATRFPPDCSAAVQQEAVSSSIRVS